MAPAPTTTTSGALIALRYLLLDTIRLGDYTIVDTVSISSNKRMIYQ
jgi:hypothetical protein